MNEAQHSEDNDLRTAVASLRLLEAKGLFYLILPGHSPSLQEVGDRTPSRSVQAGQFAILHSISSDWRTHSHQKPMRMLCAISHRLMLILLLHTAQDHLPRDYVILSGLGPPASIIGKTICKEHAHRPT